jgi:hypothetical protein
MAHAPTPQWKLARHEDWDTAHFHQFLMDNANKKFAWGSVDCCLYAASAIQAFTGVDLADDFRGKYTTELGAFRTIKKVTGGSTVADAAAYSANKYGLTGYQHPWCARRGDLVLINNGGNVIAGVVHLNGRFVVSVSEAGPVTLPLTSVVKAWSI